MGLAKKDLGKSEKRSEQSSDKSDQVAVRFDEAALSDAVNLLTQTGLTFAHVMGALQTTGQKLKYQPLINATEKISARNIPRKLRSVERALFQAKKTGNFHGKPEVLLRDVASILKSVQDAIKEVKAIDPG